MVENQHQKISGYRDLSQEEINMMNTIKDLERKIAIAWDEVYARLIDRQASQEEWDDLRTSKEVLKHGFMCLIRVIANPDTPWKASDFNNS